jgi:hypothetical protein
LAPHPGHVSNSGSGNLMWGEPMKTLRVQGVPARIEGLSWLGTQLGHVSNSTSVQVDSGGGQPIRLDGTGKEEKRHQRRQNERLGPLRSIHTGAIIALTIFVRMIG